MNTKISENIKTKLAEIKKRSSKLSFKKDRDILSIIEHDLDALIRELNWITR